MDNKQFNKIVAEQSNLRTAYKLQLKEKRDEKNVRIRAKMQEQRLLNPKKK